MWRKQNEISNDVSLMSFYACPNIVRETPFRRTATKKQGEKLKSDAENGRIMTAKLIFRFSFFFIELSFCFGELECCPDVSV